MSNAAIVTFLLDRSGSMQSIRADTIGAYNTYIKTLKEPDADGEPDILYNFIQFDDQSIDKVYVNTPIKDVDILTVNSFVPRGWTPLVDAAYKTIKALEQAVKTCPDRKVIVCIQTDGEENASREYTTQQLQDLIKEKTALGWQFNFMGASVDAYAQAAKFGVGAANAMSYNKLNAGQTKNAFAASARNTRSYMSDVAQDTSFSAADRMAAGDAYYGGAAGVTPPGAGVTGVVQQTPPTTVPGLAALVKKPAAPSAPARPPVKPIVNDFTLEK